MTALLYAAVMGAAGAGAVQAGNVWIAVALIAAHLLALAIILGGALYERFRKDDQPYQPPEWADRLINGDRR